MTLALAMGRPDVDGMLSEITSAQFSEWMAYYAMNPWGSMRDDLRAGTIAAAIYNAAPFKSKGAKGLRPGDFFESLRPPKKAQTQVEIATELKVRTRMMGGSFSKISRK